MKHAKEIVIFCAGIAFIAMAALSETQRARLGDLGRNSMVVTNVTDSGGAPGNYETVSNRAMNADGNFLSKDGPFVWAGSKLITLLDGGLTLDNSSTGGSVTYITYESVSSGGVSAKWEDVINAANSANPPSAPEVTTALRWRADGTACVVTVAAGGTLTADTSEWTEGQAVMAIITLADGAGIEQGIELVGYGAWPVGTPFVACCYRVGLTVFVVPSTTL